MSMTVRMWETTQRLFQQLHQDDDPVRYRASSSMTCYKCGMLYRHHPYFDEQTYNGYPVDHRLCTGEVVHL